MDIIDRINAKIGNDKGAQKRLANAIGQNESTITYWKNGNTLRNYAKAIFEISNYFGWSVNYLVTGEESHSLLSDDEQQFLNLYKKLSKEDQIRVLERMQTLYDLENQYKSENSITIIQPPKKEIKIFTVAAGAGVSVPFDEDDRFEKRSFDIDIIPDGATCGVPINGKSMEPDYPDGCIVWVHETETVRHGEVVIAILNGEPLCKIYEEDGLHSYNSDFPTIHVENGDNIDVLGKVIGYYMEETFD